MTCILKTKYKTACAVFLIVICLFISPVFAQDEAVTEDEIYPRLGGNVIFRLGDDYNYDADTPNIESNESFLQIVARPNVQFSDRFLIDSEIRMETAFPPSESRFFDDQAIFVRKLYGRYLINDQLSLDAGKFTPTFAFASLTIPGMYGNNFSKEIELIERVGVRPNYSFDLGASGKHRLSGSFFFDDTSILSDSLITSRGRNRLSDGGASNTESFESYTLSLEGSEIAKLPGFTYRMAIIHEEAGEGDMADEDGFLLAAMKAFDLKDQRSLTLVGEIAPLWNFEGSEDDIIYTTAGITYESGPWTGILSGTYRRRDLATGGVNDDYTIQTSAEYDFGEGYAIAVAHDFNRNQDVNGRQLGLRLIKVIDF